MVFELLSVHSCYACDFVGSLIRELNDHQRKRTVKAGEAEPGLGRIIYPLTWFNSVTSSKEDYVKKLFSGQLSMMDIRWDYLCTVSVYFDLMLSPRFIVETVLWRWLAKRAQILSPCVIPWLVPIECKSSCGLNKFTQNCYYWAKYSACTIFTPGRHFGKMSCNAEQRRENEGL